MFVLHTTYIGIFPLQIYYSSTSNQTSMVHGIRLPDDASNVSGLATVEGVSKSIVSVSAVDGQEDAKEAGAGGSADQETQVRSTTNAGRSLKTD